MHKTTFLFVHQAFLNTLCMGDPAVLWEHREMQNQRPINRVMEADQIQ